MKKMLTLPALLLITLLSFKDSNAQYGAISQTDAQIVPEHLAKTAVSEKLARKFDIRFPGATDEAWMKTENGFVVRFADGGIQTWAFLTKKGHCHSTIRYYGEDQLPSSLRHQVRSTFYDYSIRGVKEVTRGNSTAFLVTIEDSTKWKVIRIIEGEMDTWESHEK